MKKFSKWRSFFEKKVARFKKFQYLCTEEVRKGQFIPSLKEGVFLPKIDKEWIETDWNPSGIRLGYLGEMGFVSAVYDPDGEGYGTRFEEGDDYDTSQIDENGIEHTFYNNGNEKGNMEGFRPNMPTHFMEIPNPEFRFGVNIGLLNQR